MLYSLFFILYSLFCWDCAIIVCMHLGNVILISVFFGSVRYFGVDMYAYTSQYLLVTSSEFLGNANDALLRLTAVSNVLWIEWLCLVSRFMQEWFHWTKYKNDKNSQQRHLSQQWKMCYFNHIKQPHHECWHTRPRIVIYFECSLWIWEQQYTQKWAEIDRERERENIDVERFNITSIQFYLYTASDIRLVFIHFHCLLALFALNGERVVSGERLRNEFAFQV